MTMTVRLNETLSEFVAAKVGEQGDYEDISEYARDLIRRDKTCLEQAMEERLRIELAHAFAAPESAYTRLTAGDVIARNKA
jgi:Arc/MetJ-type ribon-helix-helix transcriptional regulator